MTSAVDASSSTAKGPATTDVTEPPRSGIFRLTPEMLTAFAREVAQDPSGNTSLRGFTRTLVTC
ncbi:hypothetical protein LZ30DRAFT_802431 [Colletotrichum cereale]|nr:hypothetical protein LZ30DRAFT_802431 [Colletotrichum cereale]